MSHHIKRLIAEGEHQMLDFKFEISDFRKIARTLVAFANTDGGRLLVGVKDNGAIAGVRSDEEVYMVEGAARLYCRPEVPFRLKEWQIEGRKVIEVIIGPSPDKPHYAKDKDDKWMVYIRRGDQNLLANRILLKVWERQKKGRNTLVRFTSAERTLLKYLESNPSVTLAGYQKLARINRKKAEAILVNFILLKVVEIEFTEKQVYYRLNPEYSKDPGSFIPEAGLPFPL